MSIIFKIVWTGVIRGTTDVLSWNGLKAVCHTDMNPTNVKLLPSGNTLASFARLPRSKLEGYVLRHYFRNIDMIYKLDVVLCNLELSNYSTLNFEW